VPLSNDEPERLRTYESPLRERQARQTRDEILDALTVLLEDRSPDEITTKELAEAAELSERTVYRYFPDRAALVDALVERFAAASGGLDPGFPTSFEDLKAWAVEFMRLLEAQPVVAQAEALLNADPRRYSDSTREHTRQLHAMVEVTLPELDGDQRAAVTAVLRVLVSAQTWLRLREEFGLGGDTSGPIIAWAIDAIVQAAQYGDPPPPDSRRPSDPSLSSRQPKGHR
jgi:AcrR family transcriptional regulator